MSSSQTATTPAQSTGEMLRSIWQRNLPLLRQRVDQLLHAAHADAQGTLTAPQREEAIGVAHKLAGSLGIFGFPEGTRLARAIELRLESPVTSAAPALTQLATALRDDLGF
jgi:HPt (histidine-containing phosphotransfer) domain-containing protein